MKSLRWALCFGLASCASGAGQISITEDGMHDGKKVFVYTLKNPHGIVAKLTNFGTILMELHVPDRSGKMADIALGFDKPEDYFGGHPFFGATAGRVANRIGGASFTLEGKEYKLEKNNGPNTLHGGKKGFDKYVWDATMGESSEGPWVSFHRTSDDGEEGFPGKIRVMVQYKLTTKNELRIDMEAQSLDGKTTIVNLAHHSYWNLAGHGSGDILGHELQLFCDHYTPNDANLLPKGTIDPVAGTPYDFTKPKKIGQDIEKTGGTPTGYDTNFVVSGKPGEKPGEPKSAARVVDPGSGRVMEVFTSEPGVQFYTGNFLDGVKGKGGAVYKKHAGFCLETQKFPDSIHHLKDWPKETSPIMGPGNPYHHVMIHRFSTQ